ncbi:DUF2892 domain-containing protein [Kitasatospora purpeofusca]|uniref:YgaP family membrane protein n=1 Tax=Kitasatospora purpeofusca TaxID=67352 RepID=UPI002E12E699|nr:DUF2892 domain-containing protein [Kitasatospora purpeofusca]WSR37804.1 DUF2892 domain-containing protein [Kitasatospora purpeofusca]
MDRQVRLVARSLVVLGIVADLVLPGGHWFSAAVGAGPAFAAITNTCAIGAMLGQPLLQPSPPRRTRPRRPPPPPSTADRRRAHRTGAPGTPAEPPGRRTHEVSGASSPTDAADHLDAGDRPWRAGEADPPRPPPSAPRGMAATGRAGGPSGTGPPGADAGCWQSTGFSGTAPTGPGRPERRAT